MNTYSYKLQFINSEYIINWKALLIILFVIILDLSDNFYMIYSAEALHYVANLRGSWRPKVPSLLMQASMNIGFKTCTGYVNFCNEKLL